MTRCQTLPAAPGTPVGRPVPPVGPGTGFGPAEILSDAE